MDFKIDNGMILLRKQENGEYVPICKLIEIVSVIDYFDRDIVKIKLKCLNWFNESVYIEVLPSDLTRTKFIRFADKGIDVNESNVEDVLSYIRLALSKGIANDVKKIRYHETLGFCCDDKGQIYFKHYNLLAENDVENVENVERKMSVYNGSLDIKPKGTYEEFCEFLKTVTKDNVNLRLICALSLTPPILWLVSKYRSDMESMVVNISGDSSSGKTTALMLAMSLWGNATSTSSMNSLIKSWNSTGNALMKSISNTNYQGFPLAIDEIGVSNIRDFTNFVYAIASGKDKERLTSSSELMENAPFKTIVLSSGEISMRDNMRKNTIGSQLMRLIELREVRWTSSAQQSNYIKSYVNSHYGTFAPKYVEMLLKNIDDVIETYDDYQKQIYEEIKSKLGSYAERLSSKFSLIITAYVFFEGILEIEEDTLNDAFKVLTDSLDDFETEIDIARKAYDVVMEDIFTNKDSYLFNRRFDISSNQSKMNNCYGIVENTQYIILRSHFDEVLKKNGFNNVKLILRKWIELGIIVPENRGNGKLNPYNRKSVFQGTRVQVVVINIFNRYEDSETSKSLKALMEHPTVQLSQPQEAIEEDGVNSEILQRLEKPEF